MKAVGCFLAAVLASSAGCARDASDAASYSQDLVRTIDGASAIIVTEHSFDTDFASESGSVLGAPVIYERRVLSQEQRRKLRRMALALVHVEPKEVASCAFEPHHSIQYLEGDRIASTMDVCFVCGDVEWTKNRSAPSSLVGALHGFIADIGLHPERDWSALALQARSGAH